MGRRSRRRGREARLRIGSHGTGDPLGPIGEAWVLDGPFAECTALYRADTPQALQRVLVIPSSSRSRTIPDDGVAAFRRAHADDSAGVLESALLACTHRRWADVARPLLDGLVATGLLDDGHVDQLALILLHADIVTMTAPGEWLADFYLQRRDGELQPLDPRESYTLRRSVHPQMCRWAAKQRVRGPDGVGRVLLRAPKMDSRHGAATILGLLDAIDQLDAATASDVLDVGLDWPHSSVRLSALKRLVAAGRDAEAIERASRDRAAHVRRWAAEQNDIAMITDRNGLDSALIEETPIEAGDQLVTTARSDDAPLQPSLFG